MLHEGPRKKYDIRSNRYFFVTANSLFEGKPYKKRMSGKCSENVRNNNTQIPDIVIVRKMFQNVVVSGDSFCPEFVQDLSRICPSPEFVLKTDL